MTDHFAVLELSRRPWIEPETVKSHFHRLTAQHHPDVAQTEDPEAFPRLTKAYTVLRAPASRLRHLLELEYPGVFEGAALQIPPALAERFMEVATLQRELQVFAKQQSTATSLTRALAASEGLSLKRDADKAAALLDTELSRSLELLRAEDAAWDQRDSETPRRLVQLHQELAFLTKWTDELSEGRLALEA